MIFGRTICSAITVWGLHAKSSFPEASGTWSISSRKNACVSPTETVGITHVVSTSWSKSIYWRISVIFPRSCELFPGIFESFSAIFCNCSCDILIFLYILGSTLRVTIFPKFEKSSMSLKNTFMELGGNTKMRIHLLYMSSKIVFSIEAFLFFVIYFCVSANFYASLIQYFFLPLYLGFIATFTIFLCIATWEHFYKKFPAIVIWLINIAFIIGAVVFLIPVF